VEVFIGICVLVFFAVAIIFLPRTTAVVLFGFFAFYVLGWDPFAVPEAEAASATDLIALIVLLVGGFISLIYEVGSLKDRFTNK